MSEKTIFIIEAYNAEMTGNCIGVFDSLSSAQLAVYNLEAEYREELNPEIETFDECYHYTFFEDKDSATAEYYITKHEMNVIWEIE